jgi:hypothetical protein
MLEGKAGQLRHLDGVALLHGKVIRSKFLRRLFAYTPAMLFP